MKPEDFNPRWRPRWDMVWLAVAHAIGIIAFVLALFAWLCGCQNYETFTDMYAGTNDDGNPTGGMRVGSYLISDDHFDGGVALDASGIGNDEVTQAVGSPLFLLRWRAAEYLQPFVAAGPGIVYSDNDDWDAAIDLRAGIHYRLGDVAGKPWWVFLEVRGLYADIELEHSGPGTNSSASHALQAPGKKRGNGPPCFPYDGRDSCDKGNGATTTTVVTQTDPLSIESLDEWSFHFVLGMSLRW